MSADDERTLTPTFHKHWCMPYCADGCDIKGTLTWHHEEPVRYTAVEIAENDRLRDEMIADWKKRGLLP